MANDDAFSGSSFSRSPSDVDSVSGSSFDGSDVGAAAAVTAGSKRAQRLYAFAVSELQRTAVELGVPQDRVFEAVDTPAPKETLIALILGAEDPTSQEATEQAARLRAMRRAEQAAELAARQELAERVEQAAELAATLRPGRRCVYYSLQARRWLPAIVEIVHADGYRVDLNCHEWGRVKVVDAQRIRRLTAMEDDEHRSSQLDLQIGAHVQYFNQPSGDWIEAVVTDVAQNARGRVNGVSLKVLYSKHWPVADVTVERVPPHANPSQVRALTQQNIDEEQAKRSVRWEAALQTEEDPGGVSWATEKPERSSRPSGAVGGDPGDPSLQEPISPIYRSPISMPTSSDDENT